MKLKKHILARIKATQANVGLPSTFGGSSSPEVDFAVDLDKLHFKKECFYKHNIMKLNYTTYDVRRAQDVVNPNTDHRDIMLLSAGDIDRANHQYAYARVIGIYHVNVIYTGSGASDYRARRMEFLWVRRFMHTNDEPVQSTWSRRQLNFLQLLPAQHENAFGFVDPDNVLRGAHIIPRFAMGRRADGRVLSECARDLEDWRQYCVNR